VESRLIPNLKRKLRLNNSMDAFIELIKIIVPASIVLYAAYLLVRSFIAREIDLKKLEIRGRSIETTLPLRLQAYERMALFLERISPNNLLLRLAVPGLPAKEFQQILLNEIRDEYNHNVSQQIFMSEVVWDLVRNAKEDLIMTINDAITDVSAEGTTIDLSKRIMERVMNKSVDPIALAMSELKKEIQQAF
jgi:hypothetical protein